MLVDSHCHLNQLDLTPYHGELSGAIDAATTQGVTQLLCVCIDMEHFSEVLTIAEAYPHIHASVGLHPTEIEVMDPSVEVLSLEASHPKVVAVGETGLDYYRSQGDLTWQRERFRRHIRAAKAVNKPLIVHTRDAREDTLQILKEEGASTVGGVMHCFTENWEMAQRAMDLNFYISFSGIVTFRSAEALKQVAKQVPMERLLIETDAPYLAPMPHRGKPNEPAYVRYVAEYLAVLRDLSFQSIADITMKNYKHLFSIK